MYSNRNNTLNIVVIGDYVLTRDENRRAGNQQIH